MENYIVSARKYRPSTFKSVVGQKALTTTLKNAIASQKLAHAYLFCGPRGVGKTTCARIFAKTINCFSPSDDGEACNACESCVAFNEQRSFNIHELDAASNNSVEDIRSLIDQVRITPQIGKYKVYIIDEVHMLSSAAFNAFLKTLEEPPRHAIFILATTEKHKILPTILSRCQIYDFSRISIADTVEHLQYVASQEGVTAEEEALNVLAQKADGGMRDALSIFDQVISFTGGNVTYQAVISNLNVLDYEYYFRLTDSILNGDVVNSLLVVNEILSKGFEGGNIITGLASHLRDLLLCRDPQTAQLFEVGASIRDRYIETAKRCENKFLYEAIDITNSADLNYRASKNKRLLIDLTLIKLCQLIAEPDDSQKKKSVIKPIAEANSAPQQQAPKEQVAANPRQPIQAAPRQATVIAPPANTPSTPPKERAATPNLRSNASLGVSISAFTQKKEEKEEDSAVNIPQLSESFTANGLTAEWMKFAEGLTEEHHLKNTMISCPPTLLNPTTFEVIVNNPMQEQRLVDDGTRILTFIRGNLKNTQINMQVRVSVENEKKLAFTAREKFELMAQENPDVLRLFNEFGLEIS